MGRIRSVNYEAPVCDCYEAFDFDKHFRPRVDRGDFYKLSGEEFLSFLLQPLNTFVPCLKDEPGKSMYLSFGQKLLYFWVKIDEQIRSSSRWNYSAHETYLPLFIKGLDRLEDHKTLKLFSNVADGEISADEYNQCRETTMVLLEEFIRANPHAFCTDELGRHFDPDFNGVCETYYDQFQIKQIFRLRDGKADREFYEYYPNGGLKESIQFNNGKKTGEQEEYHENGRLKHRVFIDFETGRLLHQWFAEDGSPVITSPVSAGCSW